MYLKKKAGANIPFLDARYRSKDFETLDNTPFIIDYQGVEDHTINYDNASDYRTFYQSGYFADFGGIGFPGYGTFTQNPIAGGGGTNSGFYAGALDLSVLGAGSYGNFNLLSYDSSDANHIVSGYFIFDYSTSPITSVAELTNEGLALGNSGGGGLFTPIAGGNLVIYGDASGNPALSCRATDNYTFVVGNNSLSDSGNFRLYEGSSSGGDLFIYDATGSAVVWTEHSGDIFHIGNNGNANDKTIVEIILKNLVRCLKEHINLARTLSRKV